jgi:hypothetical protein
VTLFLKRLYCMIRTQEQWVYNQETKKKKGPKLDYIYILAVGFS